MSGVGPPGAPAPMSSFLSLQEHIRAQAHTHAHAAADLQQWLAAKETTEAATASKRGSAAASSPAVAVAEAGGTASAAEPAGASERARVRVRTHAGAHTYDRGYAEWDKFDADAALVAVDEAAHTHAHTHAHAYAYPYGAGIDWEALREDAMQPSASVSEDAAVACARAREEGNAAFSARSWRGAVHAYTRALAAVPGDALAYSNRAQAHMMMKEWRSAAQDASCALELDPHLLKAWLRRGLCRHALGQHAAAERDLRVAMALAGGSVALADAQSVPAAAQSTAHKRLLELARDLSRVQDALRAALAAVGTGRITIATNPREMLYDAGDATHVTTGMWLGPDVLPCGVWALAVTAPGSPTPALEPAPASPSEQGALRVRDAAPPHTRVVDARPPPPLPVLEPAPAAARSAPVPRTVSPAVSASPAPRTSSEFERWWRRVAPRASSEAVSSAPSSADMQRSNMLLSVMPPARWASLYNTAMEPDLLVDVLAAVLDAPRIWCAEDSSRTFADGARAAIATLVGMASIRSVSLTTAMFSNADMQRLRDARATLCAAVAAAGADELAAAVGTSMRPFGL